MNSSKQYKDLLSKYLSDNLTEEEKITLAQYLSQHELDEVLHQHIQQSLEQPVELASPKLSEADSETLLNQIISSSKPAIQRSIFQTAFFKYGAAAAVLLAMVWGIAQFYKMPIQSQKTIAQVETKWVQQFNQTGSIQEIVLADGSQISLHPNARITYTSSFEDSIREVKLEGNAFFTVASNPDQPFIVRSKNLTTRVLGTSFLVSIDAQSGTEEVAVKSGKVQVTGVKKNRDAVESNQLTTVILLPNQKAVFEEQAQVLSTKIVDHPTMLTSTNKSNLNTGTTLFRYEQQSLSSIVKDLENAYGVKIEFANTNLGKCLFTGDLSEDDLFVKLKILCLSIGADYEIQGTSVILTGTGCN